MKTFALIGMSHKNAPASIRENAAFTKNEITRIIKLLRENGIESLILSTCNRSEIYLYGENPIKSAEKIYHQKCPESEKFLYSKQSEEGILHFLWVVSGFDSMVQGEDQILGQVRDAWDLSKNAGGCGKVINYVVQQGVHFAKQAKKDQELEGVPRSLAATAVKEILKDSEIPSHVLIIGAGNFGKLTLRYLAESGLGKISMTSRTGRPHDLFTSICPSLEIIPYEKRYEKIKDVDVVISATSASHLVLRREEMKKRKKKLLVCDLALPRDVDPEIGKMEGVRLYTLDHYQKILKEGDRRVEEAQERLEPRAEELSREMMDHIHHMYRDELKAAVTTPVYHKMEETEAMIDQMDDLTDSQKKRIKKRIKSGFKALVKNPLNCADHLSEDEEKEALSVIQLLSQKEWEE